eukprot:scaffold2816_cov121-Cylindrotheca_fusiformis.AAC.46
MGFAPGAFGGFCSVFVGHPIDLIKVQQQVSGAAKPSPLNTATTAFAADRLIAGTSTFGMLRSIFVKEGINGLYRGVQAPLLAVTPGFAVSFWSFDFAGKTIRERAGMESSADLSVAQATLAGAFSGIPLALIFGPTERIKCLMQVEKKYNGFFDCARKVYLDGGIRSVTKGTFSTALRDVPGNAAYFGTYEFVKKISCDFEGREKPSILGTLLAGGCAGVGNWIIAIPFDTIKSRWQTAPTGKYSSIADVLRTLLREEGSSALFRGLSPALLRAFPANAACLLGVETMKSFLEGR